MCACLSHQTCILLVGIKTSLDTVEANLEDFKKKTNQTKTSHRYSIRLSIKYSFIFPQKIPSQMCQKKKKTILAHLCLLQHCS